MKTQTFHAFLKRARVAIPAGVPNFKLPFVPWIHQAHRLRSLMTEDSFGLFDDCATGKTLVMQSATIMHKANSYRSMVIMPPALLEQFQDSFRETFEGIDDYLTIHQVVALTSTKKASVEVQRKNLVAGWRKSGFPDVLLLSYQMFIRNFVQEDLVKHYQIFIADEAHNLRNWEAKASRYFHEILHNAKRESALILSTATPMYRDPSDAYGLIKLTNPSAYSSEKNFRKQHVIYKSRWIKMKTPLYGRTHQKISEVVGFKNLELLKKNLYAHAARITKDVVLPMAKPTIIEVPVQLSKAHLKYYRDFARARIAELSDGDVIEALNAQALRQELLRIITNCHDYTGKVTEKSNALLAAVDTLIDGMQLGPENKLVLFANSTMSVALLAKHYEDYNPALVYGKSNSPAGIRKFLKDDTCTIMVANPHSAGAGLNLQSVCSTFMVVEPITIPGLFKQASERFPRAGQKHPVTGYILKPLGTLAATMTSVMLEREGFNLAASPDRESFMLEIEGGE